MQEYYQNYIDGLWVDGGAGSIDVTDPANGKKIARHALADKTDIDRAVRAAKRVYQSALLYDMRPIERGRMVQKMGQWLLAHKDEIATMLTLEQGKPLWEAHKEIQGSALYFEYYGNQASTLEGRSIPLGSGYCDFTNLEPYGVSAQVMPWNFPVEMAARSLAVALTTGNTVIIKSSEITPITARYFALAGEAAGFPAGTINIVCGFGQDAGVALTSHPEINHIAFTGSVATGIAIARAAANNVVPCVLELGGKSAAIVHDDASLDVVEKNIRMGIFFNAGQVCSAMSRVIVHESLHDELVERAVSVAQSLCVGPGIDLPEFGNNMGSMINETQRDRAVGLINQAARDGAKIATGGHALNHPGVFLEPTIIYNVNKDMTIAQEEIFGPALSIMSFKTEDEAIKIANSTEYGLVGGVFTQNIDRALTTARKIRAGQIYINEWYAGGVETPFGGYGKSGYGREKGREALLNYVQTKNIAFKL